MPDLETAVKSEEHEEIEDLEAPAETQGNVSGGMAAKPSPADPTF
jgi:hypothetical protein